MQPLRLAFYGDDFTGSTDALEVLAFAGLRCALFLKPPNLDTLSALGPFDAIGVAGDSRSLSPVEMEAQLPSVLAALSALPLPMVHYKVCSTFDSSPQVGCIGKVMDLARAAFGDGPIPIVAGTPALGRYCAFGNLFARSGTDGLVHRLDRHPIMSHHPVTPMAEADLAVHLAAQTRQTITRFTLPLFAAGRAVMDSELSRITGGGILFDGTESNHMTEVGRQLERLCADRHHPLFCVGSSGLEYAMTQWWQEWGRPAPVDTAAFAQFEGVDQVFGVSGSASPLSAMQIDAAIAHGFIDLPVDARALVAGEGAHLHNLIASIVTALRAGHSVMVHTARGPADARIAAMTAALAAQGMDEASAKHTAGRRLAQRLGQVVDGVLREVPVRRLLLSGGDTASHVTQHLAPDALTVAARLAPGAPLCRVLSDRPHLASLQIALKGGQMGQADYFIRALRGTRT